MSLKDTLQELKDLFEQGLIDEAEYQKAREDAIARNRIGGEESLLSSTSPSAIAAQIQIVEERRKIEEEKGRLEQEKKELAGKVQQADEENALRESDIEAERLRAQEDLEAEKERLAKEAAAKEQAQREKIEQERATIEAEKRRLAEEAEALKLEHKRQLEQEREKLETEREKQRIRAAKELADKKLKLEQEAEKARITQKELEAEKERLEQEAETRRILSEKESQNKETVQSTVAESSNESGEETNHTPKVVGLSIVLVLIVVGLLLGNDSENSSSNSVEVLGPDIQEDLPLEEEDTDDQLENNTIRELVIRADKLFYQDQSTYQALELYAEVPSTAPEWLYARLQLAMCYYVLDQYDVAGGELFPVYERLREQYGDIDEVNKSEISTLFNVPIEHDDYKSIYIRVAWLTQEIDDIIEEFQDEFDSHHAIAKETNEIFEMVNIQINNTWTKRLNIEFDCGLRQGNDKLFQSYRLQIEQIQFDEPCHLKVRKSGLHKEVRQTELFIRHPEYTCTIDSRNFLCIEN